MDLEIIILSKVRHRKTNMYITYMWDPKKNYTSELNFQTNRLTGLENELAVTSGQGWG